MEIIEEYLKKPYWVIDFLPRQVPHDSKGQYFKIEEYFLHPAQHGVVCRQFSNILLKLNCYYPIALYAPHRSPSFIQNPPPQTIAEAVASGKPLYAVFPLQEAMIVYWGDELCMPLYNPDNELLALVNSLANAEGLFVWKPDNQD